MKSRNEEKEQIRNYARSSLSGESAIRQYVFVQRHFIHKLGYLKVSVSHDFRSSSVMPGYIGKLWARLVGMFLDLVVFVEKSSGHLKIT